MVFQGFLIDEPIERLFLDLIFLLAQRPQLALHVRSKILFSEFLSSHGCKRRIIFGRRRRLCRGNRGKKETRKQDGKSFDWKNLWGICADYPTLAGRSQFVCDEKLDLGEKEKGRSENFRPAFSLAIAERSTEFNPGGDLRSHTVARAVSSAQRGLTTVFGMGTGVTLAI